MIKVLNNKSYLFINLSLKIIINPKMRVRREIMKRMIVSNNKSHKLSNSNKLMDQMMQPS
jgi:hypothetical protein